MIDDRKGNARKFSWSEVDERLRKLIKNGEYDVQVTGKLSANKTAKSEKTLFDKYNEVKQKRPDNIVLYRVGDFFEVIGEDAKAVAEWADLTLTSRNNPNAGRVPMVGFPYHKLESFMEKIREHQNVTLVQEENGVVKEYPMATLESSKPKVNNPAKEKNTNVRTEKTVPDTGNAESGRGVGEKDSAGKGSTWEEIQRKIKEILRKSSVERSNKSVDGRGSNRVEQKETAEAFEDRMHDEGHMYAVFGGTAVAYKQAPKSKWNENARVAAEHLESHGVTVVVFDREMHYNRNGVTETSSEGAFIPNNVPMTDAKYDSLQSVTDVLDANKAKKAA